MHENQAFTERQLEVLRAVNNERLLLPVTSATPDDELGFTVSFATIPVKGRKCVLAFTSVEAMQSAFIGEVSWVKLTRKLGEDLAVGQRPIVVDPQTKEPVFLRTEALFSSAVLAA